MSNKVWEREMSNKNISQKRKLEHWEVVTLLLMLYDFLAIGLSYFAALWVRFDCRYNSIQKEFLSAYYRTIVIYAVFCIVVFWFLRLYKSIWRFASYAELLRIILATAITGAVYMIAMFEFVYRMPISYFVFGIVFQFCLTLGIRFAYRFILLLRGRRREEAGYKKRVMLVGAGAAGQMIFRDIKQSKETNEKVYCFMVNTVSKLFYGIPINGYAAFNMKTISKLNDAVGGVTVTVPEGEDISDELKAGTTVTLTGDTAETFVRYRDNEEHGSNNQRIIRQKQFLINFFSQAVTAMQENVSLPATLYQDFSKEMITNIGLDNAVYLMTEAAGMSFGDENLMVLQGEAKAGDVYDEFYVDDAALYELILNVFYTEVKA